MSKVKLIIIILIVISKLLCEFLPTWESLDNRPLPEWYNDAKFGVFIHWGVYSVPAFHSEWFWYNWKTLNDSEIRLFMSNNYPPKFSYPEFAKDFTAELLDFEYWIKIIRDSGAKYVVITSKHHEGYTLWPSKYSYNWNSMSIGPKRDLIGEFANALRQSLPEVRFGIYYSLYEWFNPIYLSDKQSQFTKSEYVKLKIIPEIKDLITNYQPEILWADGDWEANETYWSSKELLAWLYNNSTNRQTIVTNDRWGQNVTCKHGDFYTCQDRFEPHNLIAHKWENCMTIDKKSWGYRRNADLDDYFTSEQLIIKLVQTVSLNGNIIMNIGPNKDGTINPIFHDRLKVVGSWLKTNGESIFNTKPWIYQTDEFNTNVWYTQSKNKTSVYAIFLKWSTFKQECVQNIALIIDQIQNFEVLGVDVDSLIWSDKGDKICFVFLKEMPFKIAVVKILL